jgi:hypothetical protein
MPIAATAKPPKTAIAPTVAFVPGPPDVLDESDEVVFAGSLAAVPAVVVTVVFGLSVDELVLEVSEPLDELLFASPLPSPSLPPPSTAAMLKGSLYWNVSGLCESWMRMPYVFLSPREESMFQTYEPSLLLMPSESSVLDANVLVSTFQGRRGRRAAENNTNRQWGPQELPGVVDLRLREG